MKKVWIATYVDAGETCDGKPRILKACATEDEARAEVYRDMEKWTENRGTENVSANFSRMSASVVGGETGCEWNIEEVAVPE